MTVASALIARAYEKSAGKRQPEVSLPAGAAEQLVVCGQQLHVTGGCHP